jgi:FAD/FMN-containing dehydrogenase
MLDKRPAQLDPSLLARFAAIIGAKYVITDQQAQQPYLVEMRDLYHGSTPAVLRPGSVAEVSRILALANTTATPIVPQGGNTGLVGGQIPFANEVVLSLTRLDRIREVDPISNTITCEAGVTLQRAREAAEAADRLYPQLLPSEGTCTIGGNLSTNAGGTAALAYGVARSHLLGIEVVLADGRVFAGLNKLKKDNTGYDLKHLFVGAEGTLGIITAAVLRLIPRPRSVETAFVALASPQAALAFLDLAEQQAAGDVTSFELMARRGIDLVLAYAPGTRDPLPASLPWYVLIELSSQASHGLRELLELMLSQALQRGFIADAAIAGSLQQAKAFWQIREMFGEVQRHAGGSIKHDISVPIAAVPAFIEQADAAVATVVPGVVPLAFGHLGDGNIHYNVGQPPGADKAEFLKKWDEVSAAVFAVVKKFGGSISAEHGIGVMKRDLLPVVKDPVALELMRGIKGLLDPNNILNPGKVL